LILDVDNDLSNYDPTDAGRKIEAFVDHLSNWYVRRSRRRFWKSENDTDKISAYNTLYSCLVTLTKLLAPFMPFLAEELYQNLVRSAFPKAPESVHLTDFPVADAGRINKELTSSTQMAIRISSLGRAARSGANIKVRQPLAKVLAVVKSRTDREGLQNLKPQILEELNVKEVECVETIDGLDTTDYALMTEGEVTVAVCTQLSPELEMEGMAREIVHRIQTMRKSAGFEIADHITTYYDGDEYIQKVMQDPATNEYIKQEILADEVVSGVPIEGGYSENFKLGGHTMKLGVIKKID
jgi:isoleucyl-tRNA synthetase